jgi:hypothetical protein
MPTMGPPTNPCWGADNCHPQTTPAAQSPAKPISARRCSTCCPAPGRRSRRSPRWTNSMKCIARGWPPFPSNSALLRSAGLREQANEFHVPIMRFGVRRRACLEGRSTSGVGLRACNRGRSPSFYAKPSPNCYRHPGHRWPSWSDFTGRRLAPAPHPAFWDAIGGWVRKKARWRRQ